MSLKTNIKKIVSYNWLINHKLFVLFLSMLIVLYVGNGHSVNRLNINIEKTTKNITHLEAEYKSLKSELITETSGDKIIQAAQPLGLQLSNTVLIKLEKDTVTK